MRISFHLVFSLVTILAILTYLGSYACLLRYLRRAYTMFWVDLGEPTFSQDRAQTNPFEFANSWLNALLFVFSNQHRAIADRRLTALVWLVRASFAFSALLVIIQIFQ